MRTLSSSSGILLTEGVEVEIDEYVPGRDPGSDANSMPSKIFSFTNSSDCSKASSSGEEDEELLGAPLDGEDRETGMGLCGKCKWYKYSSDKPSTGGAVQRNSSALYWPRLPISESA